MKQIILPGTVHLKYSPAPCPLAARTGRRAHRPGAGDPCLPGLRQLRRVMSGVGNDLLCGHLRLGTGGRDLGCECRSA